MAQTPPQHEHALIASVRIGSGIDHRDSTPPDASIAYADLRRPDAIGRHGDHVVLEAEIPERAVAILDARSREQEVSGIFFVASGAPVFDKGATGSAGARRGCRVRPRQFLAALATMRDVETPVSSGPSIPAGSETVLKCCRYEIALGLAVTSWASMPKVRAPVQEFSASDRRRSTCCASFTPEFLTPPLPHQLQRGRRQAHVAHG